MHSERLQHTLLGERVFCEHGVLFWEFGGLVQFLVSLFKKASPATLFLQGAESPRPCFCLFEKSLAYTAGSGIRFGSRFIQEDFVPYVTPVLLTVCKGAGWETSVRLFLFPLVQCSIPTRRQTRCNRGFVRKGRESGPVYVYVHKEKSFSGFLIRLSSFPRVTVWCLCRFCAV